MNSLDLVFALRDRDISYANFRNALKHQELPVSNGWEGNIEKLEAGLKDKKTKAKFESGINEAHWDLMLYGDKIVKVFQLETAAISPIAKALTDDFITTSPYKKQFPAPLNRASLNKISVNVFPTSSITQSDFINIALCSKQYITEREELPNSGLNSSTQQTFGAFDKIIGIRRRPVQLFDIIAVDIERGLLEIRLDGVKLFNAEDVAKRTKWIVEMVNKHLKTKTGIELALKSENFYPAIKKMYDAADGKVKELGHVTDAAGIYNERMRHKSLDVRDDPYHSGGAHSVAKLHPFSIGKHWPAPNGHGNPEILIPAHFSIVSQSNPFIDTAYILGCSSEADYNFVLAKALGR